jgi:hypothetical protein
MDISLPLNPGSILFGIRIKIVNFDPGVLHDLGGDGIVLGGVTDNAALCTNRDRSGVPPNEAGLGLFKTHNEFAEIFFIVCGRYLGTARFGLGISEVLAIRSHVFEVVEAPVEMDDVPLFAFPAGLQPSVESLQAMNGCGAIDRRAVNVGLSFEKFADGKSVSNRDGVSDQKDPGEGWVILDRAKDGGKRGGLRGGGDEGKE